MTAVTTYATLQTRLGEDCNRTDAAFVAAAPGFIHSAEAELRRSLSRTREAVGRATATEDNEYELAPTDFGGVISLELTGTTPYALEYITPDAHARLLGYYTATGKPLYYTILGTEFRFLPEPGEGYTISLVYWRRLAALSGSNTTNWLLLAHPDAYLWASLVYAYEWLKEPGSQANALAKLGLIIDSILSADRQEQYGAVLQARPSLVV